MSNLTKVQKKKKNSKMSAFWSFAFDFKHKQRARGISICTDSQLRDMAGYEWAKLSEAEKARYKEGARNSPAISSTTRVVYNSLGQSINEMEAQKEKELKEAEIMKNNIQMMLDEANNRGELDSLVFYFISASSFIMTSDEVYPAELAMAKFSLKQGVFDHVQIRINPGRLPTGTTFEAQEKSKKFHKYPLPPNCAGEEDYMAVFETMIKFLHPLDEIPILFADNKNSLKETQKIVSKIFYESREDDILATVKVYPVVNLFFALQRMAVVNMNRLNDTKKSMIPSLPNAEQKFTDNKFSYLAVGCDYHAEQDANENCCLTRVRFDGYVIAKWCSDSKRYPLKEGNHYPEGCLVDMKQEKQEFDEQ